MNQKALLAKTLLWIAVLAASIGVCLWIVFALDEGSGTMSALQSVASVSTVNSESTPDAPDSEEGPAAAAKPDPETGPKTEALKSPAGPASKAPGPKAGLVSSASAATSDAVKVASPVSPIPLTGR